MEKKAISEIVKDSSWQKVRESLLGKWKENPSWCCNQLRSYLGNINNASNDKIRILMNYLTGSAFRMGKIKSPCITLMRTKLSMEIKKRKAQDKW